MFARHLAWQVADIEHLLRRHPEAVVLWAGDFNQSLEGPNLVGSAKGRQLLGEALGGLGFVAWNRGARHATAELCAIDLVCGPKSGVCGALERIEPESDGQRLSDHAGYVVDVDFAK